MLHFRTFGCFRTTRPEDGGALWPFRRVLEVNERLSRDFFKSVRLAPTFPVSTAKEPRANGEEGHTRQVRDQEHQADWHDPLHQ